MNMNRSPITLTVKRTVEVSKKLVNVLQMEIAKLKEKRKDDDIEYVCKDAFIEKACEKFEHK